MKESCPACGALPCDWVDDPHTKPAEGEPVAWPEAQLIEFIERNTRRGRNGAYIGDVGAFVRLLLTPYLGADGLIYFREPNP